MIAALLAALVLGQAPPPPPVDPGRPDPPAAEAGRGEVPAPPPEREASAPRPAADPDEELIRNLDLLLDLELLEHADAFDPGSDR